MGELHLRIRQLEPRLHVIDNLAATRMDSPEAHIVIAQVLTGEQPGDEWLDLRGEQVRHIARQIHTEAVIGEVKRHVIECGVIGEGRGLQQARRVCRADFALTIAHQRHRRSIGEERRRDDAFGGIFHLHVRRAQFQRQYQRQSAQLSHYRLTRAPKTGKRAVTAHT
jgi:hypothetical protein